MFANDICPRVTEAATGRTKRYYAHLLERGTLPLKGVPLAPTNEEARCWYEIVEATAQKAMELKEVAAEAKGADVSEGEGDSDDGVVEKKRKTVSSK